MDISCIWWATLMAQMVKNLTALQETWVWSLGQEEPLKKGMSTHSSILAWRIQGTEEPGGLQFIALQRVRHNWVTSTSLLNHMPSLMLSDSLGGGVRNHTTFGIYVPIVQHKFSFYLWYNYIKIYRLGAFLVIQWLGLCTFTARAWVQSLVKELKSHKHCVVVKRNR